MCLLAQVYIKNKVQSEFVRSWEDEYESWHQLLLVFPEELQIYGLDWQIQIFSEQKYFQTIGLK